MTAGGLLAGALLQASVVDVRTGRVVEGEGGRKVPVHGAESLHLKQRAKVRGAEDTATSSGVQTRSKAAAKARAGETLGSIVPKEGTHQESRRIETGRDVLSNNGVNLLMAASASVAAMVSAALVWGVPLSDAFTVS